MSVWNFVLHDAAVKRDVNRNLSAFRVAQARMAAKKVEEKEEMQRHIDDLTVLTRALYVYIRSQPGFDPERFAAVVDQVQQSIAHHAGHPPA